MRLNLVDIVRELNNEVYESSLESCNKTWKKPSLKMKNHSDSIKVYNSLTDEQKACTHYMLETVAWNVTSSFFAWLDGIYFLKNQTESLELRFEGEEEKLNNYLHGIWVELHQGGNVDEMRKFYDDPVFYK